MQINPLKQLYTDFLLILDGCVVKYKSKADACESLDIKKEADAYVKAYRKEDTFFTYYKYNKEFIAEVLNIVDDKEIEKYYNDRNLIPYEYREPLLLKQRKYIVDNYVERNNYYRCLNGLPDYNEDEMEFIYPDYDFANQYRIPDGIPIHELDDMSISIIESTGYLKTLIEKYPKKKYIQYVGTKKIDLITARTAKNFSLLLIPKGIEESLWSSFSFIYEQCREYFTTCIYISEYKKIIDFYDNFIALCIMVMTLQQLCMRVIKNTIERDFFDSYCTKLLFETYGVPYNPTMDQGTRALITQNLNLLIQNKGTNKVIFDIASILGYDRLKIFKYYIMKTQKFDINGVPVLATKIDPETGLEVPDYGRMYDVFFQKVDIGDIDTYKAMLDGSNRIPYEEITSEDPYWVDDPNLQKELYESEYNYVESKYMGVSILYRMTNILFENVYLLRMILDKKDEIPLIKLELPKLTADTSISLFDAIVLLCAMTCKQNKLKGEILMDPSKILHVLGFNFDRDFSVIREEILNDENLDNHLADFFKDSSTYSASRINDLYHNFLDLYYELLRLMEKTQNPKAYQAYKKLYNTVFYSNENKEIFNIGTRDNPVYASTFMEYIQHTLPEMYELINSTDPSKLYEYTNHIAFKVLSIVPDLKYLGIFADSSETMEAMLVELINFFKSYTTDMIGLNIIYVLDMKPETLLRFIDQLTYYVDLYTDDFLKISYSDHLNFTSTIREKSYLKLADNVASITTFNLLMDTSYLFDKINFIHNKIKLPDYISITDILESMKVDIRLKSEILFKDILKYHVNLKVNDTAFEFNDELKLKISSMLLENLNLFDLVLIHIYMKLAEKEGILKNDKVNTIESLLYFENRQGFIDKINSLMKENTTEELLYLYDIIEYTNAKLVVKDQFKLRDTCKISWV